jgi:hypothetical protein
MAQSQTINPPASRSSINANTYLTEGGCCIGGYHSANGAQTYANFEYITTPACFSQDVSALSHEVGEWTDDPLYPNENNTPCGILEVGDPLENGQPGHPYGTWTYELHNFTYHLQDLVLLRYFGGPTEPVGQRLLDLPGLHRYHADLRGRLLVRNVVGLKPASQGAGFFFWHLAVST